ncbi:MAG TPA: LacI family DNA-binding transcriptional regulator [Abditibacterium sp.]|jgi:DNA-binding LacI/PurR family transcriptional regulator
MPTAESKPKTAASRAKAVTLADVAAQAGVSSVAASVVLSNARSQVRVSDSTRARIVEAAARLQYRPNAVARSLRLQRTNIFGFYQAHGQWLDPRSPFFAALLAGLQHGCESRGKDLLIHTTFRGRSEDDIFLELINGQIDGLVLYAREITPLIEKLVESHLPVVTVVNEVPGVSCASIDDTQGGQLLARHLADRGYERVLYRRTETPLPLTLQRRMDSFCAEAALRGLSVQESRNNSDTLSAQEQELLLCDSKERPQAVAAWSDYAADGVVDFCRQNGLRVPQDLAVVGFDGLPSTLRPASHLTTIAAPWHDVASTAVSLLVAQCNGEEVPEQTVLPVQLSVGDTT